MTTIFLFTLLFTGMLLGMPVAVALGFSSVLTLLFFTNDSLASISQQFYSATSEHYTLLAIPFFILSSAFLTTGGVARRIINFANDSVGHIRGGLAMASVLACMIFAAVSGSSPATVAAIGSIVIVGMVQAGYPEKLAAGVITTAGTLGILIPPSIVMLVYAAATQESASKLFEAGLVPGLLMGSVLMVAIYIVARIKKLPSLPFPGVKQWFNSGAKAAGGLMLIFIVLGTIYMGIASPTEAAAISAVYAFFIAVWGYRDIGPLKNVPWRKEDEAIGAAVIRNLGISLLAIPKTFTNHEVRDSILDAAKVSIMLLFIIANAMLFAHVLTSERIPHHLAEGIVNMNLQPWMFLIIVNILLLIAGAFMEPSAIILIMAPILFPIAVKLGIDPIHLGIIMVVNMELGMLSPPIGLNLFVTSSITGRDLGWVIKAVVPWFLLLIFFLGLITYVPEITLAFPNYLDQLRSGG
ncbi:TRAP transporter large permease subunit [Suttonella sp. R2A3]|uniref:TRAP transporter large permease n=1 Tax=Suttonella sp. R2A3 TaxID=2908648 RepID=UPI001F2B46C6|nr:TRAP transporter large permease subunit [Suttonella sp. R2A3]UJF24893.1 TRAP transporter large permease subunit [Suttonella sp. R2A3]